MADFAYRIDNHGDSVRPDSIQSARAEYRAKRISAAELRAVEDQAILEFVECQRQLALSCVTDGEYRNGDYRSPILHSVAGFRRVPDAKTPDGLGIWTVDSPLRLTQPIASDAARFLLEHTGLPVKVTLPSAAHIAAHTFSDNTTSAYPAASALGDAIAQLLRDEIEHLFELGVAFVQVDNPDYSAHLVGREIGALSFDEAVEIDNATVSGLEKREDQNVALAIGWGDDLDAPIDIARAEKLFATDFETFSFPYHTDAAVAQDLPRYVPHDKQIGLGIVDATDPRLEDESAVKVRLDRALDQHDSDRIGLLPHRGFHPIHYVPSPLTIAEQRRKLEQVEAIASTVWGDEA